MKKIIIKVANVLFRKTLSARKRIPDEYFHFYESEYFKEMLYHRSVLIGKDVLTKGKLTVTDYKNLILGEGVSIGKDVYFESVGGIVIGDSSIIGEHCKFYTVESEPSKQGSFNPIYIGKNVTFGKNVTVLPGTMIADGSYITTGSVVKGKIHNNLNTETSKENSRKQGGEEMFFVVSTGRSGSASIAEHLSSHPDIDCYHEPRNHLIRLSSEYEYGNLSFEEVVEELNYIYNQSNVWNKEIYGESHQKLSNLILPLSHLFPKAKFIWLIRDGKKVVKSAMQREWYFKEKTYVHKYRGANGEGWRQYRLEGDKSGVFTQEEWENSTAFEKNCWYWNYWNNKVKSQFEEIEDNRKLVVKLENLLDESKKIQDFLKVDPLDIKIIHTNKSKKHQQKNKATWTEKEEYIFKNICGELYQEFYG